MNKKEMQALVEQLFVNREVNKDLVLNFRRGRRENYRFLVMAIRYWAPRIMIACNSDVYTENDEKQLLPEDQWEFAWTKPTSCGGCTRFHELLDLVGHWQLSECCTSYSYGGWKRRYRLSFRLLKILAAEGIEAVRLAKQGQS